MIKHNIIFDFLTKALEKKIENKISNPEKFQEDRNTIYIYALLQELRNMNEKLDKILLLEKGKTNENIR